MDRYRLRTHLIIVLTHTLETSQVLVDAKVGYLTCTQTIPLLWYWNVLESRSSFERRQYAVFGAYE